MSVYTVFVPNNGRDTTTNTVTGTNTRASTRKYDVNFLGFFIRSLFDTQAVRSVIKLNDHATETNFEPSNERYEENDKQTV